MTRPLLRARLRYQLRAEAWTKMLDHGERPTPEANEALVHLMGSDAIADRVLDRLSAEHGSGGLLDLLLVIDWVKLLEVILAVVALFKSGEVSPQGACETGESQPGQGGPAVDTAEAKRERMDQLRQAESD